MLSPEIVKTHTCPPETSLSPKDYSEGFKDLTEKEKKYAFNFSRASWAGVLVTLHQVSYESPLIFCLYQFYFNGQCIKKLEEAALKAGADACGYSHFLSYFAGFLGNAGNYIDFGYKKIIPNLSEEYFLKIFQSAPHFGDFEKVFGCTFDKIWSLIGKEIFAISSPYNVIGMPNNGGTTGYFSRSLSNDELDMMNRFLASKKQSPLNTRSFKKEENGKTVYEITVASIDKSQTEEEFEGKTIRVVYGEFSEYLTHLNNWMEKVVPHARSELQADMIKDYIAHFKTGDVNLHIESQKKWIKDKGPVIETNIGFVETYLDPQNIRAYFEGFVSIVNKTRSKKYSTLVDTYEQIIESAPWPRNFCKDEFKRPDFTSLDIITFASQGCPLGINIPNYDLVRNDIGFKNVYLANNALNYIGTTLMFIKPEDMENLRNIGAQSFNLHVALHELIGHGSGKLFFEDENGKLNYDPETTFNLLTGEKVTSHYKHGETWNEKFGRISCSFEECRADVCGFYLAFEPKAYEIFGFTKENIINAVAANILTHLRKAVLGLKLFNIENKKWGQAHTQGAFVFLSFILRNQDPKNKVLDIMMSAQEDEFTFVVNRDQLAVQGRKLIGDLLKHLQQYKSTADNKAAEAFYNDHSKVNDFFLKIRKIVIANQKPRRLDMYYMMANEDNQIVEKKVATNMRNLISTFTQNWDIERNEMIQMILREWNWRGNTKTLRV
jgi:dipeptidyl-peptidase-3